MKKSNVKVIALVVGIAVLAIAAAFIVDMNRTIPIGYGVN